VAKTGRLAVADLGWKTAGITAEVITLVCETVGSKLKANPVRITLPDSHTPMSSKLEEQYYPTDEAVIETIRGSVRS
jgi:pyruvate/2-oxoglutarate/acetoin dehydrogenase E1 component